MVHEDVLHPPLCVALGSLSLPQSTLSGVYQPSTDPIVCQLGHPSTMLLDVPDRAYEFLSGVCGACDVPPDVVLGGRAD